MHFRKNLVAWLLWFGPVITVQAEWAQIGQTLHGQDAFGVSVAMSASGHRVIIGAPGDDTVWLNAGKIQVFEWDGIQWNQIGQDLFGSNEWDMFGRVVAMDDTGSRIAASAPEIVNGTPHAGHVCVFDFDGTQWIQAGQDIIGEAFGDASGTSVSISGDGNRLAIGAPYNDDNGAEAGHVRVYDWNGLTWNQMGLDIDGINASDESGAAVAISGNGQCIAIGSPSGNYARIFQWQTPQWIQMGQILAGEDSGHFFGTSVALSRMGDRVVIGDPVNSDVNPECGHARVYEWGGSEWIQLGEDIDGQEHHAYSGSNVAMADNGNRVSIAARGYYGFPIDTDGYVRQYDWNGSSWTESGLIAGIPDTSCVYNSDMSDPGDRLIVGFPWYYDNHVKIFDWTEPSATPTMTATPTPLPPTPTPTPLDGIRVELLLPQAVFTHGDTFSLDLSINNLNPEPLLKIPLFIILDVAGVFYYYPEWSLEPGWIVHDSFPNGLFLISVIPSFSWPVTSGPGTVRFWAALTDERMERVLGDYDMKEIVWE